MEELTPSVRMFGKYRLLDRIGRGGMAEVWKAQAVGPHDFARTVVIKRLLPELSSDVEFVKMFGAEARLSAQLRHANVVQVFEFGAVDGELFLVMEYVHGRDLIALLRTLDGAGTPPGEAAYVARELCRALAHAHAAGDDDGKPLGIVHRDVSPSNVMLAYDGSVKLVDFGIAKALAAAGDEQTKTGILKGKLAYMAPELLANDGAREIDHRVDQYAVGVVLHELLTGRRLFKGATLGKRKSAIVPPPSSIAPDVPPSLERVCLRALEADRERRFADCGEMARALDEIVRELAWGPEAARDFLCRRIPERIEGTHVVTPAPLETDDQRRAPRRSSRARRLAVLLAATGAALIAGLWLGRAPSGKSAPPASAPAPSPPPPAELPAPAAPSPIPALEPTAAPPPPTAAPPPPTAPAVPPGRAHHAAAPTPAHGPSQRRRSSALPPGEAQRLKGGGVVDPFAADGAHR